MRNSGATTTTTATTTTASTEMFVGCYSTVGGSVTTATTDRTSPSCVPSKPPHRRRRRPGRETKMCPGGAALSFRDIYGIRLPLLLCFIAFLATPTAANLLITEDNEIKGVVGEEVDIPCPLGTKESNCGNVHSVKWYQDGNRVYVHSAIYGYSLPEGRFEPERAEFFPNATPPVLKVAAVQLADEGTYKCDVTYVTLTSGCPSESKTKLITVAKPKSPEIYLEGGTLGDSTDEVVTGTRIGPFHEEDIVNLMCEAGGGKPVASVSWWNGTESMGGYFTEDLEDDKTGTGRSTVRLRVSRADLLTRYDCQVTHETLDGALTTWVELDVFVPPTILTLDGGDEGINEGKPLTIKCSALHARPAATITWYNGSEPLSDQPAMTVQAENGNTFSSYSTLTIVVTRFDDEEVFACSAANKAMEDGRRDPLRTPVTLTVFYPPVVTVTPSAPELELEEGATLRLECVFEANPANGSSVTWLRNGKVIVDEDDDDSDTHEEKESGSGKGSGPIFVSANARDLDQDASGDDDNADAKEGVFHLVIKNVTRHEAGQYSCMVSNVAGAGISDNSVNVSVLYPPEVRMIIFPTTAIEHVTNVTLTCEIEEANPDEVTSIRWLDDGEVFNVTDNPTLTLIEVDRDQHSNYSCQAENKVGWGEVSEPIVLNVLYTPGRAKITHLPEMVIKGDQVTMFCHVEDFGNPPISEYLWKRGEFIISDIHTSNWTTEIASLQTQDSYVCNSKNSVGDGLPGTVELDVKAPPRFIDSLLEYHGALSMATDISLTCQVECDPECDIQWLRNGRLMEIPVVSGSTIYGADDAVSENDNAENETEEKNNGENGNQDGADDDNADDDVDQDDDQPLRGSYTIKVSRLPANPRHNHFASVISSLRWNMTAWPGGKLDRGEDSANYTCRSTRNVAGPRVSSTTMFHVEYPPENISLTATKVDVEEGETTTPVKCTVEAHPEVTYMWTYEGKPVSSTNELPLDYPAYRGRSGLYTCTATNIHGNVSMSVVLDVLFKPECELIATMEEDIGTILTCTAVANPNKVEFDWLLDNETMNSNIETKGLSSRITQLRPGGRYTCTVNNSVGQSDSCTLELEGSEGALIAGFGDNRIIIIVLVVAAIVIVAVVVCIIIILLMRRRAALGKYCNRMDLEPRENPEGHSQPETKRVKPGRKPGAVTFKRVESESGRETYETEADKERKRGDQGSGPADGDRAFYENLPFHGLQPAPNKELLERPVPAPRDYSPTKMRHIYQNLLLPLRASKTNPLIQRGGATITCSSTMNTPGLPPPPPPPLSHPNRHHSIASAAAVATSGPEPTSATHPRHHHHHHHHQHYQQSSNSSENGVSIPAEGVVYADLALNAAGMGLEIKRRDRPTEYAVLSFCRDNTASEV